MRSIEFVPKAWAEYQSFQNDKKTMAKINTLIQDIARNGTSGLGKPEALKGDLSGFYSRRIDSKHRIIYRLSDLSCQIVQIGGHYGD